MIKKLILSMAFVLLLVTNVYAKAPMQPMIPGVGTGGTWNSAKDEAYIMVNIPDCEDCSSGWTYYIHTSGDWSDSDAIIKGIELKYLAKENEDMYNGSELVGYIVMTIIITGFAMSLLVGGLVASWKDKEIQKLKDEAVLLGHAEWQEYKDTNRISWKKK
jgi:hypothetical protein